MSYSGKYFSNLFDHIAAITKAVDLMNPQIAYHHQKVAYVTYFLAEQLALPIEEKRIVVLAAMLHDVGSLSLHDNLDFEEEKSQDIHVHAFIGADLLKDFYLLNQVAQVIRFHHVPWKNGENNIFCGKKVPYLSHLIHLADRVVVKINQKENIITQSKLIREIVESQAGMVFEPNAAKAFLTVSKTESFWLDLMYEQNFSNTVEDLALRTLRITLDETVELTGIFAKIIDFRSPFTARHSASVSSVAVKLAELFGFSENDCKKMRIAGNLHDLGKLAIPREILEKQGSLSTIEFDIMKSHSYYSYRLMNMIEGYHEIAEWGAYHHEKLNGRGYPFRLFAESLTLAARIMAVADIFTAITEDRPYRAGMSREKTEMILNHMVAQEGISGPVVHMLLEHFDEINHVRIRAEERALFSYGDILL